jgi:hypothetical protein
MGLNIHWYIYIYINNFSLIIKLIFLKTFHDVISEFSLGTKNIIWRQIVCVLDWTLLNNLHKRIQVLWFLTLSSKTVDSRRFEGTAFIFKFWVVLEEDSRTFQYLKLKALRSCETSEINCPLAQRNNPEDLNLHHQRYGILKHRDLQQMIRAGTVQ